MYFFMSILDPEPEDGGGHLVAPQDVNAATECDSSKREKHTDSDQCEEEPQSVSGSAEQGGSETTQGGQNLNYLQAETQTSVKSQQDEETHETVNKLKAQDGDEESHNHCDDNKTMKSSEDNTLTSQQGEDVVQVIKAADVEDAASSSQQHVQLTTETGKTLSNVDHQLGLQIVTALCSFICPPSTVCILIHRT